jgi:hypothetical protein
MKSKSIKFCFFISFLLLINSIPMNAQTVTIDNSVVQSGFQGMGFNQAQNVQYNPSNYYNSYQPYYGANTLQTVLEKRIKEVCSNGYFRNYSFNVGWYAPSETSRTWTKSNFVNFCNNIRMLKKYNIDVMVVAGFDVNPSWLGSGNIITDATLQNKYANVVAEGLDYMINTLGLTNIKSWEISNELTIGNSYGGWAGFFATTAAKNSHIAIITKVRNALNAKGLSSVIIRTPGIATPWQFNWGNDNHPESPMSDFHWYMVSGDPTTSWNSEYGFTYPKVDESTWNLPEQYNYNLDLYKLRVARAKLMGKNCAVGEYGPIVIGNASNADGQGSAYPGTLYGQIGDGDLGMVMAEQAVGMLNAGIINIEKWTLVDLKFSPVTSHYYHGSMTDSIDGWVPRSDWYSYGLMTRYIRKNSSVFKVTSSDNLMRATAVKNNGDNEWTIVVINRKATDTPVTIAFNGATPTKALRKFEYDPDNWPQNSFGDLQEYVKKVSVSGTSLTDVVKANSIALYTTEYDETQPAAVTGLTPTSGVNTVNLSWNANTESDLCYYRIYRGSTANFTPSPSNQIASTIGTAFRDQTPSTSYYKISAVDKYGNASLLNNIAGINEINSLPDINISPNPCPGNKVRISYENITNEKLMITGLCGREISYSKNSIADNTIEIQLNGKYSSGIYLISLVTKKGIITNKLIIR